MKVIITDDKFSKYFGKEMYIIGIREYINSKGENCKWYQLSFIENSAIADLYLSPKQISLPL